MSRFFLAIAVTLLPSLTACANSPPLRYIDQGACPFECCAYRTWSAEVDTLLYARPDTNSNVVGRLKRGTVVEAITGEVHPNPGRFVINKPHGRYKPGDVLWVLTYLGEGHFKVWRNRTIEEGDLGFRPYGGSMGRPLRKQGAMLGRAEKELRFSWWVQLRSEEGWGGWSNQPEHFGNKDALRIVRGVNAAGWYP